MLALGLACDGERLVAPGDAGDPIDPLAALDSESAALTPLAAPCTFAAVSGVLTMTVHVADDETAIISRRGVDSALLVNGEACGTATSLNTKSIVISGSTGTNVVVLDFINGFFAQGYGSTPGIAIDLVSGSNDTLDIRGSRSADTITLGANGISTNTDTVRDVTFANIDEMTFSLASGNDVFSGSGGTGTTGAYGAPVTVFGGDGNDTLSGGTGADALYGGAGNDTLRGAIDAAGDTASDTLDGGDGDDLLDAGSASNGADSFVGGAGTDEVSYALRSSGITFALGSLVAAESDSFATDIEVFTGGSGDDTFTLLSDTGTFTLNGGPGNDFFQIYDNSGGSYLHHTFAGGAGVDGVSYYWVYSDVVLSIDNVQNDGVDGRDNIKTDIEKLWGGQGDDVVNGSAGNDVMLDGCQGSDVVNGLAGDDTINDPAQGDDDVFSGGPGNDTIDCSQRSDPQHITLDGVADDGSVGESDNIGADFENVIGGSDDDVIVGNASANDIDGGDGDDQLSGGAGNDTLFGGAGVDQLDGGAGDDIIDGGAGTDTPLECGAGEGDIVLLGSGETASGCEL
ncbi:MAG: calcium-binding protein [Myxococcota bacterium]